MKKLNFDPFPLLLTPRLRLRSLELKDALSLFEYQSNKQNFPYVTLPIYTEISQASTYIQSRKERVANNEYIIWAIADITNDDIMGSISLWNFNVELSKAELGYILFPEHLGQGIMSEALIAVSKYGMEELNLSNIEAYTNIHNEKSIQLLKRNNFTYIKQIEEEGEQMVVYHISVALDNRETNK